jgi:hypothetical protein
MSKLREALERPIVEDEEDELLLEDVERLDHTDTRTVLQVLSNPVHKTWILKSYSKNYTEDEREITITAKNGRKVLYMEYNADFYELTNFIVDACDDLGYNVKSGTEKPVNIQWLEIYI